MRGEGVALLSEIACNGATVAVVDGKLRVTAPPGILTAEVQARLRALAEKLRGLSDEAVRDALAEPGLQEHHRAGDLVGGDGGHPGITPHAEPDHDDWRVAWNRTNTRFAEAGIARSNETSQAATWITMLLDEGWNGRWHWSEDHARTTLEALYSGRWTAQIVDGRVLLSTPVNGDAALPEPTGEDGTEWPETDAEPDAWWDSVLEDEGQLPLPLARDPGVEVFE